MIGTAVGVTALAVAFMAIALGSRVTGDGSRQPTSIVLQVLDLSGGSSPLARAGGAD